MRTRLSLSCDKVLEACWLAALVVVPLFFNIFSQRVFEPDKLSLLRSLALVMSAFWIVRLLEDWRTRRQQGAASQPSGARDLWRRILRAPMVVPTLLLVLVYLVSTVLSVVPRVSFLGSYQRLQGTYTTLSYILIFFVMLDSLRTRRQLDRVITISVVVSFPIALYGLIQHFGLDPLPWGGNVTNRVASNMGNAIFVAAYLIMLVPLTLSRLLESWKEAAGPVDGRDLLRGLLAFALLAAAMLAGMLVGRRTDQQWVRWVILAVGLGLQVPVYWRIPAERRSRILAIALPLTFAFLVAFAWLMEIFLQAPKGSDLTRFFWMGLLAAVVFILAMVALAIYLRRPIARLLLVAAYAVIGIAQVVCILYSGSRGPWLGLAAGILAFLAVLGLVRHRVWLSWTVAGLASLVLVVLVLFNTLQAPWVERLREMSYIGRAGTLLKTDTGTGKVRVLIWGGVVEMISPHPPLWAPEAGGGSTDRYNAVRPLFGYGPEAMYVAYNSFYPPDLAHVERRNASPDRSHNETFDALATTGLVGFLVYMFLFTSAFYYALKWMGLVRSRTHRLTFMLLWIGGGLVGALATWLWRGPAYIGLGIPLGTLMGLAIYLLICIVSRSRKGRSGEASGEFDLWLVALFAAIVAHFVEIHFGIAIAATRTYFWIYAALLVAIGTRLSVQGTRASEKAIAETAAAGTGLAGGLQSRREPGAAAGAQVRQAARARGQATAAKRGRGRQGTAAPRAGRSSSAWSVWLRSQDRDWWAEVVTYGLLAMLVLATLLFDYTTVPESQHLPGDLQAQKAAGTLSAQQESDWRTAHPAGIWRTVWYALAYNNDEGWSPAMLVMILVCWGAVALVALADLATRRGSGGKTVRDWLAATGAWALISLVGALVFGLVHAARLKPVASSEGVNPLATTIADYYGLVFAIVLGTAAVLAFLFRRPARPWRAGRTAADLAVIWAGAALPAVAGVLLVFSNVRIVQADILYKQGYSIEKLGSASVQANRLEEAVYYFGEAVGYYRKAIALAPTEDFYYLFLGRAQMEKGQVVGSGERDAVMRESEEALEKARQIAPLNTDHSANLARLYRTWGALNSDAALVSKAVGFYLDALRLSPHSAQLWTELGQTYAGLGQYEQALEQYRQSLEQDSEYVLTYQSLGELYVARQQWADAIAAYEQVVRLKPNDLTSLAELAAAYGDTGQADQAVHVAKQALKLASEAERGSLVEFIISLGGPEKDLTSEQTAELSALVEQGRQQVEAGDLANAEASLKQALAISEYSVAAHHALAVLYAYQDRGDEAIAENLAVLEWLPDSYISYKNLADLYLEEKRCSQATDAANKALELAPDDQRSAVQLALSGLKLAGCFSPEERDGMYQSAPAMTLDTTRRWQATIVTDKGEIVISLNAADAPQTVNNFAFLAQQGYYDGLTFHRAEHQSGFELIQGGDPTGTGKGGPGYTIPAEIELPHLEGAIAMARLADSANPERASSGSQFYITLVQIPQLDGAYTVFGYVTKGLDVARQIAVGDKILAIEVTSQ